MARFGELPSGSARQVAVLAGLLAERNRILQSSASTFLREVGVEGLTAELNKLRTSFVEGLDQTSEQVQAKEGLLALWLLHYADPSAGFGRVAAQWCTRLSGSFPTAIRLWLMDHAHTDPEIVKLLLEALKQDIIRRGRWLDEINGAVIPFFRACVVSAVSIQAVLSVLRLAAENGPLPQSIPHQFAIWLAGALGDALRGTADEDQQKDLQKVQALLQAPISATETPRGQRGLQRVVLDLLDIRDELRDTVIPLDPLNQLVDHVRRRQLLDDAGQRAIHEGTPVQTLRVLSERVSTRVVQAFVSFGEAIVSLTQNPDFSEGSAPDYGTQVGWAPAASVPFHLFFGTDESRIAFNVMKGLTSVRGRGQRDALLADLDPTIAEAAQRFLTRLFHYGGEIELVLTDPASPDWQRSVSLTQASISAATMSGLAQRANAQEQSRRVAIYKNHVPQANTVRQVFQAVDAMMRRGVVTPDDISDVNSNRQVDYYKHGARTLGLFDEDNQPTDRARALVGLPEVKRLALVAVYFEDSPVGRAWRAWAGKSRLNEVDPRTAEIFLEECAVGLTKTTPTRRASTLRTWFNELMPYYPT